MWLRSLTMRDFRNHHDTGLEFTDGLNVICGPNGAGKTSVLEAVNVLAFNSSFRTHEEAALIRAGTSAGVVDGTIERGGRSIDVRVGLGGVVPRFLVNGAVRRRARDVVGILRAVVFSPDDLEFVKGAPAARRAFLDVAMVAATPRLETLIGDWERVLRQRNQLLRSWAAQRQRGVLPPALVTWTDLAAEKGAALAAGRRDLAVRMLEAFREAVRQLLGVDASLRYEMDWTSVPDADADTLRNDLLAAFAAVHDRELERGLTLAGPHHDDLVLEIDGRAARARASQGEQRVLALALRLSQMQVVADVLADDPVLLLDDVLSELDPRRRAALVERLPSGQALLTTTAAAGSRSLPAEVEPFRAHFESTELIRVEDGAVA